MSLSRLYEPFFSLSEVDNLLDKALTGRPSGLSGPVSERPQNIGRGLKPRMNLKEDHQSNMVLATFELPGLSKDKVKIEVNNDSLLVSGELTREEERTEEGFIVKECSSGRFSRAVGLPPGTQANAIHAHMENGLLTVKIPRTAPGQETRRVTID